MKFDYFQYKKSLAVSDLTACEKAVADAYAASYNPGRTDGLNEESSKGTYRISLETGFEKTAVGDARKVLIAKGWITSQRRMGKSSLTAPTIPAGFDYEAALAEQDAQVLFLNEKNKKRVRKAKKTPVSPSKVSGVSKDQEVITGAENKTVSQDEALEQPTPVSPPEGTAKTIINQSINPELAMVFYLDVGFAPRAEDDIARAAAARTEADYLERKFISEFDDYGDEDLNEFLLRKRETTNA